MKMSVHEYIFPGGFTDFQEGFKIPADFQYLKIPVDIQYF